MRSQEIAQRYARALFELSQKNDESQLALNEIRAVSESLEKDQSLMDFFTGPTTAREDQLKAMNGLFDKNKFSENVKGLLTILIQKRRFDYLSDIAKEFQTQVDQSQGIARGEVQSASALFPEERKALEATISKYIGKQVVLEYREEPSLVGGLVAKVGSFTFDDTIETQLRLMREEIKKRRAN